MHCVPADQLDVTAPSFSSLEEHVVPNFDNPLAVPTALGQHSVLRLRLFVTEPVVAQSLQAPGLRCLSIASPEASSLTFECQTIAEAVDGPISMTVTLTDAAQLTATLPVPLTTAIDVTVPPPPDEGPGQMRLRSAPWGDSTTKGVASLRFSASPGAIKEAVSVRILAASAVLASQAVATDGSAVTLELPLIDSQSFSAQSIDAAGNQSLPSKIRDLVWVASFFGKRAGEAFPNPHRFEASRAETEALEGVGLTERGEADGIAETGGALSVVTGAGSWRRRTFNLEPDGLGAPSGAYDPRRARIVRFSGLSRFGLSGTNNGGFGLTVWEWNGHDWLNVPQRDPEGDGSPEPRLKPTLLYSARLGGIVLFGGSNAANKAFADAWLWNGDSWRRLPDAPVSRIRPILYEDRSADGLVMYSGEQSDGTTAGDAWLLGAAGWRQVDAGGFPTPRLDSAWASDLANDATYVTGGMPTGETWKRSGATWVRLPSGGPTARTEAAAAWDDRRGVFQVYGGALPDGGITDELWELSGTTWSLKGPNAPGPRSQLALVYDGARAQTVLFGKAVPFAYTIPEADAGAEETWAYSGSWQRVAHHTPALSTWSSRNLPMNDTAGATQTIGLAGTPERPTLASLTATGWALTDLKTPALPLGRARLAYEVGQDDLVLFAGKTEQSPAEVWRITGASAALVNPDAGIPATGIDAVVSFNRTTTVVTTGLLTSRVERLVLGTVTNGSLLGARLVTPCAVVTPQGDVIISGFDLNFSTQSFRWDGSSVTPLAMLPINLGAFGLVYDTARNAPVMIGGVLIPVRASNDVYELRGATWSRVPVADPDGNGAPHFTPSALDGGVSPVVGFDTLRERAIAIEPDTSNVWEFDIAHQRPQVQLRFSIESIPQSATLTSATLTVVAGGTGGFSVFPRMPGYWSDVVVSGTAQSAGPKPATLQVTDSAVFRSMLATRRELSFGLRPKSFNGVGTAEISVDAAELEVQYRLP